MSSQARIDANRRNAQKFTGPRTPEGKARSSQNALHHGLASISHHRFLAAEDRTAFERILAGYVRIYQPAHADEVDLLTDAVFCKWRQQRAWSAEAQLIEMAVALNQRDLQKKLPKSQHRRSGRLRLYSLCGTNPTAPPLRGPVTSPISSQSQRVTRLTSLPAPTSNPPLTSSILRSPAQLSRQPRGQYPAHPQHHSPGRLPQLQPPNHRSALQGIEPRHRKWRGHGNTSESPQEVDVHNEANPEPATFPIPPAAQGI